jgi:hypothetical protein
MCKVGSVLWTRGISWRRCPLCSVNTRHQLTAVATVFCEHEASADRGGHCVLWTRGISWPRWPLCSVDTRHQLTAVASCVLRTRVISWPRWPAVFCHAELQSFAFLLLSGLVYVEIIVVSRSGASCGGAVSCSVQQSAHCGAGCSPTPFALSTWILRVLSVYFVYRLLITFGLTPYSLLELFHLFYASFNCFPSCAFLACQRRPAVT